MAGVIIFIIIILIIGIIAKALPFVLAVFAIGLIAGLIMRKKKADEKARQEWERKKEEDERELERRKAQEEAERRRREQEQAEAKRRKEQEEAAAKKKKEAGEKFDALLASIPAHKVVVDPEAKRKPLKDCKKFGPDMSNVTRSSNLSKLSDFVAIDTETTGLHCSNNQIVELTAIRFREWEPVEIFTTLINPGHPIPEEAYRIHGIADEMVEDAPSIASVIRDFDSFIGSDNLVGHNLPFDLGFLDYAGSEYFGTKRKYYDTLTLAKLLDLYDRDNKLTTLCEHFCIRDNSSAHRSASDALAAGLLFKKLVDLKTV